MRVKKAASVAGLVVIVAISVGAQVPAGTVLPVRLSSRIDSHKNKVGDRISARVMQDVPLSGPREALPEFDLLSKHSPRIPAGSRLLGEIVDIQPSAVSLKFDRLSVRGKSIPVRTSLRALASMMEIEEAQLPTNDGGGDRGSSELDWNTVQVGGDLVYGRRGGAVVHDGEVVGHSVFGDGVLLTPIANSRGHCRGFVGVEGPQAFWLFSASACGVYGYSDVHVAHAGRSDPVGVIVLSEMRGKLKIQAGSGLLLRVAGN